MSQWYYQLLGEEFGPVSTESLRLLAADGTLGPTDLVRAAASADWKSLADTGIPDADTADIITDLDELNFKFEESHANPARRSPKNHRPQNAENTVSAEPLWYHQFAGQVLGPVPLSELLQLAESGGLSDADKVRCGQSADWQSAGDVPELSAVFLLGSDPAASAGPVASSSAGRTLFAQVAERMPAPKPAPATPTATPAATAPPAPAAAPVIAQQQKTDSAKKPHKGSQKGGKKADEKLVENILNEVFSEPEPPRESTRPPGQIEASAAATAPAAAASNFSPPTFSPPASSAAPSAAAARSWSPANAPRPASKPKSSGGGFSTPSFRMEFNGPTIALLAITLLAAFWFGYGPVMRYLSIDESKYVARAEAAIATLEKVDLRAGETELYKIHDQIYKEFNQYVMEMHAAGATGESSRNCLAAMNRLMEVSRVNPQRNPDLRKKLLEDAKKLVSMWKSQ